jgi:nitrogen fixation protein
MRKSMQDFLDLIASGMYYVLQKKGDNNCEDITLRREDGASVAIPNYPYRDNQMPAYIFDEFLREGIIKENGSDEFGGTIFRIAGWSRERPHRAA